MKGNKPAGEFQAKLIGNKEMDQNMNKNTQDLHPSNHDCLVVADAAPETLLCWQCVGYPSIDCGDKSSRTLHGIYKLETANILPGGGFNPIETY